MPIVHNSHCLNEGVVVFTMSATSSALDLLFTVMPMPHILKLRMPLRKRLEIITLMCVGGFATIAGAVRTYYSWKALMGPYTEGWDTSPLWLAATIEIDLGIVSNPALLRLRFSPFPRAGTISQML